MSKATKAFKMADALLHMGWLTVIGITVLIWFIPLLPFKATLLFFCGVANGRFLARWI